MPNKVVLGAFDETTGDVICNTSLKFIMSSVMVYRFSGS